MKKTFLSAALATLVCVNLWAQKAESKPEIWKDSSQPTDVRVKDLISRLTLEEKVTQLWHHSDSIQRLSIPQYNWWGEALHGVARNGKATIFPQIIGMAATFDEDLMLKVGTAVSDEARAKFNDLQAQGRKVLLYQGLSFWAPNVNIFRDPRWGRGQETYGEDPLLTAKLATAYVKGLQGNDPNYLKVAACAKHYVVHSGPEADRHTFNAIPPKKDFYETYTPAFKALVQEAKVEAVMCAYNRTYDKPCCGNPFLLKDLLRKQWGFQGHILTDCWAINDFDEGHKVTKNRVESVAMAINAGANLECGVSYDQLKEAVKQGLVTEKTIDEALFYVYRSRFKLGLFDPADKNPYSKIGTEVVNSPKHVQLAREAAQKSMVLIKNKNNALPLNKNMNSLMVLGPNASNVDVLLGNYNGFAPNMVTFIEGIMGKVSPSTRVEYRMGFLLDRPNINPIDWASEEAKGHEAVVVVMGIHTTLEGEEGEAIASPHKGDRLDAGLPKNQIDYLKTLREKVKKPIIVVLTGGSPICEPELENLADAIIMAWYPGEQGGNGLADVLFGEVAPSGKMPLTFPKSLNDLPAYNDYSMKGRTYRYMQAEPFVPFGFGLSYTSFEYSAMKLSSPTIKKDGKVTAEVSIKNTGKMAGEEVVQLYIKDMAASVEVPQYALKSFKRVSLQPGDTKTVSFEINTEMLKIVNNEGLSALEPGDFTIYIGGTAPGKRSESLGAPTVKSALLKY